MARRKKVVKVALIVANVLLIIGLGFSSGFYFVKYRNLQKATITTEQRIVKYEKEISKSFTLPSDEKASIIDIKKADDFKKGEENKDFFKDSSDGDVVLIYQKSKLGILYRPATKKIIKTGPLAIKDKLTVSIVGAKVDRDSVLTVLKQAFLSDISNAIEADAKTPLTGSTVIVDVTGTNADLVKKLATELKGKVGDVPTGQDKAAAGVGVAIYAAPVTP